MGAKLEDNVAYGLSLPVFASGAVLFLSFLTYLVYQLCSTFVLSYDSGLIAIGSDLLVRGGHLYKDLHTVMLPGSYFTLAIAFILFGSSQMVCNLSAVATIFGVSVLLLILTYQFVKGYEVYLPTALVVVFGIMVCPFVNHHWDSLFWILAYANALMFLSNKEELPRHLLVLTGLSAGFSIICYQNQLLPVIAGLVAFAFSRRLKTKVNTQLASSVIYILAGLFAVLFSLAIYLVSTGSFVQMLESTVSFVLERYESVNKVDYGFSVFESSFVGNSDFPASLFAALPFGFIKLTPLLVFGGLVYLISKAGGIKDFIKSNPKLFILFVLAVSLFVSELHKPDLKRLIFGDPLLFICLFYFAGLVRYKSARILIDGFYLSLAIGIVVNVQSALGSFYEPGKVYQTRRGQIRSCVDLSVLKKLDEITKPYEKVLIYPYDTGLSYLSQTVFPGRFPTLQYKYHSRKNFEDVISDMESSKVRFVVFNRAMNNQNFSITGFPRYKQLATNELILEPYLKEKYQPIGTYGIYSVFKRVGQ